MRRDSYKIFSEGQVGRSEPGLVTCLAKQDKAQHRAVQEWLAAWVEKNEVACADTYADD